MESPIPKTTRIRLHFPTDRSVHIGDLRLALITTLWAWSKEGKLVATNDNPAALEDLNWLDVEPDEVVPIEKRTPAEEVINGLLEERKAYKCFCTPAIEQKLILIKNKLCYLFKKGEVYVWFGS